MSAGQDISQPNALHVADALNCAYQAGGDAETLRQVAYRLAPMWAPQSVAAFLDVAGMGGLDVWCEDVEREAVS